MEEANDADGPKSGRKAHKKKILVIDDSEDDSIIGPESENSQLTSGRKSNLPLMEEMVAETTWGGSDDSSDELETENSDDSSDEISNDSNSDRNSDWTTDSEEEDVDGDIEDDDDITQPSTSRACTRRSRQLIDSCSDEEIVSEDEFALRSPTQLGEVNNDPTILTGDSSIRSSNKKVKVDAESMPQDRDNFQGSSSETDDGEGPKTRCPICLRSLPGPSAGAEVGSPEGCQHLFCVCCIQEWAKNVNTCPVDRHEFSEIVVFEGVGGKEMRRLPLPKKPRGARGALDDEDITLISQIEEDPTFCEICGSGDREDSLLLCDGCDRGYHLDCLTPPLTSVPIEEWFCSRCTGSDASRQRATRASRNTRMLPRTSASQRVLRSLRRDAVVERGHRGLRTWNIDSHDLELMEEMAELEVERRWAQNTSIGRPSTSRGASNRRRVKRRRKVYRKRTTTRKKRKTVTKKRLVKRGDDGEAEEEEEVEEEEVTTTSRRRRGKRRKGAGKKLRRGKKLLSKRKGRSRLAETLGIVPGRKGILLRKKGICGRGGVGGIQGVGGGADGGAVINGTASGIGGRVPTLSIFGSRNDLEYFSDGSDVEGGGGSLAVASIPRRIDSVHAHQLAKERLISSIGSAAERRKALIKERALASSSPSTGTGGGGGGGVPDILGSIMESQSVWHGRKSKVKLNSDGSIIVEKSKKSNHSQDTDCGDSPAVGPKSIETTNINNEMNVNSGAARVPSNPAEPSTAAQDSCSTFREGSSGVEVRDSAASVETRESIDSSVRSVWPVRTLDADLREESSSANRKDRLPSQNVNETHYANRAPSTTAAQSVVTTSSRATNNFRSIEHLAGNVIVNSNRNYLDTSDDGCHVRLWESQPTSSVKSDRSVISSGFTSHVNPIHGGDVMTGGNFGMYGFSPNSPLDLSSSSHKGDARELLHRNMYLDLSSGGRGNAGFGPTGYDAPYAGVTCEAVDMRVQSLPNAAVIAEDLRVAPIPNIVHPQIRSLSVIKENPSIEPISRSYGGLLHHDIHADIVEPPVPPSERGDGSVVTPPEAVKTVGLPGSSGSGTSSQTVNSSVRDMGGSDRALSGGGGARGGTNQRLDYARANSSYGSESRDANGPGNGGGCGGGGGGGGGGGDRNDRPQLLKRHLDEDDEDEDDEKEDREEGEDEDVDIYSDIEPGGSDPPMDTIAERHGMPVHVIETPPDQGPMFHPSLQTSGSDKYDPAEPSYDTDDEMVIDEEGGNEDESHTPRSNLLEGEVPPPPPLPPSLMDSIAKSPEDIHGYDRERSVTPTEEDERRKAVAVEDSEGVGRPPVGVRVYGILSQGKFGLGVNAYGSDDEDEDDDEECPNFSIYSATSVNIARTAEAEEEPDKEIEEPGSLSEKVDESLKISHESASPTEEVNKTERELNEELWDADESVVAEKPASPPKEDNTLGMENNLEGSFYEKESSHEKDAEKSDTEKSDIEDEPTLSKSDAEPDKSDAEAELEKSSDLEGEKSDDGAKKDSKSMEESIPNESEVIKDDGAKEVSREEEEEDDKEVEKEEVDDEELESGEREAEGLRPVDEGEKVRDIVVPELEGLETETISEAEEATAFEDLESSKRRSCVGEEEEGEIVDDRARDKCLSEVTEKDVNEKDVEKEAEDQETHKVDGDVPKKDGKKEGKRRVRKKADASKGGDAAGGDAAIAWKKLSKLGKERNYREKGVDDPNQSKKDLEDKEDKENRRGKKERDRRKAKRKDLERYDVRKVVGERSKTKRRRTDAFGRELRSNSRSRSRSRVFSRSRSRGIRSRSRGRSRSPRGRSRSRGARSRSRGVRSRSRGRRSRSRGGRSRSRNSRSRLPSKSRGRSRSRGKGRRSRSRSRVRQRSRSRGVRSRSRGGRSRSRQRSRERVGRRGENVSSKATTRKKSRRSRSPVSERRKQSRSRSRQRKRSRSRSKRRRAEQSQGSWERSWTRSWTRSMTPIQSRSLEKTRGHMRSRSLSGSRILRDRSPIPMSRSPSRSRGRSFCRSPSTPTLPPPPRSRMGLQSISRSPSRSPERMRSPAMASVGANKKKRRKKEGRVRKEVDVGVKKRKKRRERSPAASKEVFASGDNILVSVSFKSAPKENSSMPKRRKASSPAEEKVKVMEEPTGDSGMKKKRKFMPVIKKKPSVIIDLETSPFVERVPSPADLIVLSDSSGENEDKSAKQQQQQMDSDLQRRHRMMLMSPVQGQKSRGIGVKEKRVGGKVGKKGKLGTKGKKTLGKKDRKVAVATSNTGLAPTESVTLEETPLPHSVPEEPPLERRLGPKTPPEPQVKFCIASKGSQLRSVNNPLREDDEDEDDIIASEAIAAAAAQLELGQKVMVQVESETVPPDGGIDGEMEESEAHQTVQVGPNTPPGPSTPDLEGQFSEVGARASPTAPQEEVAVSSSSRTAGEEEVTNKEGSTPFEEPSSRKDQEMDTYDPFEPTNSPAPSPPAPETEPLGHQNADESRDVPSSALVDVSSSQAPEEQRPVEEEVAVAEPKVEESAKEPTVEEPGPTAVQGSVQGVANIARTLGTTVGAIDAVGGFVLPLLAQLGAVAQPQPLNAAVAAVTSANSPIIQQQLSPLVNRAFPQQPQQAKAADVIRTLFGTGLRQFPEMVASSGAGGAFSVTQPKVSKADLSLGARGKGGPRVAVTAPRVAVATPRVVVPTPRVAVTPRVATANGKDQPPGSGQDRVDVVDMDLESPYSPASSEGDDLFEPPSYESAGSARQTSVLGQQSQQNKSSMKGGQRSGSAPSQDKFDNLFGSSPMRRNSGGGKGQSRSIKNHKGGVKAGKSRGKTGGKVNVRSEEDHHLTILDELPNSAVEMQVKEKFLIKLNRQERVVEEVKLALKPHYNKKHLSKEEYKDILRRSVPKICHNRSGEINPVKIRSLVEAYVRKFRYARKKDSSAAVTGAARANKGKKPT